LFEEDTEEGASEEAETVHFIPLSYAEHDPAESTRTIGRASEDLASNTKAITAIKYDTVTGMLSFMQNGDDGS
jgi:hypothetical protein